MKLDQKSVLVSIIVMSAMAHMQPANAFSSGITFAGRGFSKLGIRTDSCANPSGVVLNSSSKSNEDQEGEGNFDVESARKQLESMIGGDEKNAKESEFFFKDWLDALSPSASKEELLKDLPPPPPVLSSIERDRRSSEIALLRQLEDSDSQDITTQLWNLWYSERGQTAKTKLEKTDNLMGDPTSWVECETKLFQLIDEYGIYWVEPVNRLATLYYLQGDFTKSYQLCQIILMKLKPWHFGALSGIVQVCIGMSDRDGARYWAEKRLPTMVSSSSFPPFTNTIAGEDDDDGGAAVNPRRKEWVDEAVSNAKKLLKLAEKQTKKSFGKPEEYYSQSLSENNDNNPSIIDEEGNDDAWQ